MNFSAHKNRFTFAILSERPCMSCNHIQYVYDRPAGGVKLGWPYKKHFCGTFYDESMLLAENAKILCCPIEPDI